MINLYDIDYKGCRSCMVCNMKDGESFGHCAVNDGLKEVLEKIDQADGLILGSPIYFGDITAQMRALLERLLYQYFNFDNGQSLFTGHLKTGFIYTMNATEGSMKALHEKYAGFLSMLFEYEGTVESAETLQVEDYKKYHLGCFDGEQRHERREKVFMRTNHNKIVVGFSFTQVVLFYFTIFKYSLRNRNKSDTIDTH